MCGLLWACVGNRPMRRRARRGAVPGMSQAHAGTDHLCTVHKGVRPADQPRGAGAGSSAGAGRFPADRGQCAAGTGPCCGAHQAARRRSHPAVGGATANSVGQRFIGTVSPSWRETAPRRHPSKSARPSRRPAEQCARVTLSASAAVSSTRAMGRSSNSHTAAPGRMRCYDPQALPQASGGPARELGSEQAGERRGESRGQCPSCGSAWRATSSPSATTATRGASDGRPHQPRRRAWDRPGRPRPRQAQLVVQPRQEPALVGKVGAGLGRQCRGRPMAGQDRERSVGQSAPRSPDGTAPAGRPARCPKRRSRNQPLNCIGGQEHAVHDQRCPDSGAAVGGVARVRETPRSTPRWPTDRPHQARLRIHGAPDAIKRGMVAAVAAAAAARSAMRSSASRGRWRPGACPATGPAAASSRRRTDGARRGGWLTRLSRGQAGAWIATWTRSRNRSGRNAADSSMAIIRRATIPQTGWASRAGGGARPGYRTRAIPGCPPGRATAGRCPSGGHFGPPGCAARVGRGRLERVGVAPVLDDDSRAGGDLPRLPMIAPPMRSECPPMYLVSEWITRSHQGPVIAQVRDAKCCPRRLARLVPWRPRRGDKVGHLGGRVGDRLEPHQAGAGRWPPPLPPFHDGPGDRRFVARHHGGQQAQRAAVHGCRRQDLVASSDEREHRPVDGGHAGRGGEGCLPTLQLGQRRFQRRVGRVRVAGVRVPRAAKFEDLLQLGGGAYLEGAGLVDRDRDGVFVTVGTRPELGWRGSRSGQGPESTRAVVGPNQSGGGVEGSNYPSAETWLQLLAVGSPRATAADSR